MSMEKAYEMLHKFMNEVSRELDKDFYYCVTGSLRDKKYVHGKSDIDVVAMPKKGVISPRAFLWMIEYGKKYGEVFKKGRMISIFDVLIPLNTKSIKVFREQMLKLKKEGRIRLYETNKRETIIV